MATNEQVLDGGLLSVNRTAARLGIGRGTTYRLIRNGEIPSVKVGGSIRVDPRELDRWIQERTRGAA